MNHLQGSKISNRHSFNQDGMGVAFQPDQFPQTQKPIKLNKNAFIGIGITQIIIGVICFILNIVQIALNRGLSDIGYGIWGGIFFFISGLLSLLTGKTSTNKCLIVATMVMNIISACVSILVLTASIMFAGASSSSSKGSYITAKPYDNGIGATIAVLAIIEAIISITCSALCCNAYCCCCSPADNVIVVHGYPGNFSYSNNSGFQAPVMLSPQFSQPQPYHEQILLTQPQLVSQQPLSSQNNGFQMIYPPLYDSKEKS